MGIGILACGLNGAGKSTLGKNPAKKLGFSFIDAEDLYFPRTGPGLSYACPRTRLEARALFLKAAAWIRGQEEAARWRQQVPNRPMDNG